MEAFIKNNINLQFFILPIILYNIKKKYSLTFHPKFSFDMERR